VTIYQQFYFVITIWTWQSTNTKRSSSWLL